MVSLLALCLISLSILTIKTEAQLSNVTLQVRNSTEAEPIVNLTSKVKVELPPGGLPEVIVDPAERATSAAPDPVATLPPAAEGVPQIAAKQVKEDGELKTLQVVDPDAISTKVLGSRCMGSKDCLPVNNTSCISGICDCISGFIPSKHSLEKCIKVPTGLDDACEEEAQCAHVVAASECRGGTCSCPPNYVFDLGRCWEKQLLGGMCNTSVQCDNVELSICVQGVCACQPPLIPSPNSNKCLKTAGSVYRAPCEEDIQCTDSYGDEAHCSNSQCICTNNYHFNGTGCVPDKKLGDMCVSDVDCAVSDVNQVEGSRACFSQVCSCAAGFSYLDGEDICMEKYGSLGNVGCKTERDCVPNAYCVDNTYCMCLEDFVQETTTQTCLPISKKINDTCKIDLQCTSSFGTHALCYKNLSSEVGQCRCTRNTHFQDGLCYQSVRLGGECKVSDNCVSASDVPTYCAHSICVCAANHHPSDDRLDCLPDVGLEKRCNRDEECLAEHSYCSGVCRCLTGYVVSADKAACLPAAKKLREQCYEDSQCQQFLPNTFCDSQENNCKCVPFSHELDKSCWISAKLGEPCTHPSQCTTLSMNRSVVACSQGICSCVAGYTRALSDCTKVKDAKADSSTVEKLLFLIVAALLLSLPND